jgi:hypothetical protein
MYRMFVTNGEFVTNGDMVSVLPIMQEIVAVVREVTGVGAVDKHRLALDANPEYLAKFYEGTNYAVTGSVTQRHLVKIA